MGPWKPTREQLEAARDKTLPDVIAPGMRVLFCGINPGLYTAAVGHHFARPGNRFWPALHRAGFTAHQMSPFEERELLRSGLGITNLVARATASADLLTPEELERGAHELEIRVRKYRPRILAMLGISAYRIAFRKKDAKPGGQQERIGSTRVWVLPNPSGINASYQLKDLVVCMKELRRAAEAVV